MMKIYLKLFFWFASFKIKKDHYKVCVLCQQKLQNDEYMTESYTSGYHEKSWLLFLDLVLIFLGHVYPSP